MGDNMYIILMLKTFFLYFFIILVYRIMGKKEIGELGIGDLIVTVLIAELAAISIENTDKSIFVSIVPILVLVLCEMSLSYISLKKSKIRTFIDGHPSVIIKEGKVKFNVMSKLRYTLDDLISQLREKGVKSLEEVDYAVLETNGNLSVFQNTKEYPLPIILDGDIDFHVLKEIKKDKKWIDNMLNKKKIKLEDVFYAFYTKDRTYIIKKSDLIK